MLEEYHSERPLNDTKLMRNVKYLFILTSRTGVDVLITTATAMVWRMCGLTPALFNRVLTPLCNNLNMPSDVRVLVYQARVQFKCTIIPGSVYLYPKPLGKRAHPNIPNITTASPYLSQLQYTNFEFALLKCNDLEQNMMSFRINHHDGSAECSPKHTNARYLI